MPIRAYDRTSRGLAAVLWYACACACVLVTLGSTSRTRADEASGRWTGEIEDRGNYFWERSTRVMVPAVRVALEAPNGVRFNASELVDVISSASIAAGPKGDEVFTEYRLGIGGGVGKTFSLGDTELDLNARAVYSTETDYKSWLYGLTGSFSWNEKDTSVTLGLTRVSDRIYSNQDPTFRGDLTGTTVSLGFAQVLSPVLILSLGYQFVLLDGYLGNPYRSAQNMGQAPRREQPPDERIRHNWEAQLAWYIPATRTTVQGYARYYADTWDLRALTPELRVYQDVGDFNIRLRFRYYAQGDVSFAPPNGATRYPQGYPGPTTNDPKLIAFHSEQAGIRLSYSLRLLQYTFLDFLSRGVLDVSFDRQWCTSRFGDNIMGTLGGRLPF